MRKAIAMFLMVFAGAGCDDSVQDVASDQAVVGEAPPDTVIVENGVTAELYGPKHRRAVERSSELLERDAIQNTSDVGAVLLFDQIVVVHASVEDGRDAEMTLIPLVSATGEDLGGVWIMRIGEDEIVTKLRPGARDDGAFEEGNDDDKKAGPHALNQTCLDWARSMYNVCISECTRNPNNSPVGCKIACFLHAVVSYIGCAYLFTYT